MKTNQQKRTVMNLTYGAVLTAIVVVLQLLSIYIKALIPMLPFTVSLVLIPIVLGAALCGKYMGAWLGFVFGVTVLLSGDAAFFLGFSVPWTIAIVLIKGTACGFVAGVAFHRLAKKGIWLGAYTAAALCPIVNSGLFAIGSYLFLKDALLDYAGQMQYTGSIITFLLVVMILVNFLFELISNLLLTPVAIRLIGVGHTMKK